MQQPRRIASVDAYARLATNRIRSSGNMPWCCVQALAAHFPLVAEFMQKPRETPSLETG